VAFTLQAGRKAFGKRRAVVCEDVEDAIAALESLDAKRVVTRASGSANSPVVFMFSGQGAQYVRMCAGLYKNEPEFRGHLDACAEALKTHLGFDLRELLYPSNAEREEEAARRLRQTGVTQPALFAVEYALAKLWMSWGVVPRSMIGHSLGEYVAACLAGVFSLEDALKLVALRGRLMQEMPEGSMLAVPLPASEVAPLLGDALSLAAVNAPTLCVVSGPRESVEKLQALLRERQVEGRVLHTSHAFHSSMMEPMLAGFGEAVAAVKLNAPSIPYVSNVTGTWVTDEQAIDPAYWAAHLRQPVLFSEGVQELLGQPGAILLEVGPGQTLASLARQQPGAGAHTILASTRQPHETQDDDA
jgi:acyl transferase domain-containing protein